MALACLATISPLDPATGDRVEINVTSHQDRRVTGLGGKVWEPAITAPPTLGIQLWNGDFVAAVSAAGATLPINMGVVKHTYPNADSLMWIGAPVEIRAEAPGTPWPWAPRFVGKITDLSRRGQTLSLSGEVDDEPFARNILTATYAGTGGAEGGADLKGRLKPLALGYAMNVEPVLIDAVDNVYQFSGYGPIEAVTKLFERGSDFGAAVADYANYAALVAATIPAGKWGACLAEGLIRLGAPAYGVITGDIRGHVVGGSTPRLTGAVIQALADIADVDPADLDTDALDALDTAAPYPINLVLTDQTEFLEMAQRLALACNHQAGVGLTGQLFAARVSFDPTEALQIDASGRTSPQVTASDEQSVSVPYWRTVLGANRAWRVHGADEIAYADNLIERGLYADATTYRAGNVVDLPDGSRWVYVNAAATTGNAPPTWPTASNTWWENLTPPLSADDLTYLDGSTLQSLQPADVGATAGAPVGTPVGTIAAEDVSDTVKAGGGVAEAQVDTSAVQNNAINTGSTFFFVYSYNLTSGSEQDIANGGTTCQGSVTTADIGSQFVKITLALVMNRAGGSDDDVSLSLRRDDGVYLPESYQYDVQGQNFVYYAQFTDNDPGSGLTRTYKPRILSTDTTLMKRVSMHVTLAKR